MAEVRLHIRWRDIDNYGHVNNAVYLNYLEECRDRMIEQLFGPDEAWDFVLAHVGIDYRHELTQADREILVTCEVEGYGRSSIRTRERIAKLDGTVAADAEAVIVPRERDRPSSRPLTDAERALLGQAVASDAGEVSAPEGPAVRARSGRDTNRLRPT
jgi:acyl-CoA thioester hydrolase